MLRGEARLPRDEPGAVHDRGTRAQCTCVGGGDPRSRGRGACPAGLVREILEQHLGEEVVRRLVGESDQPFHRRRLDAREHARVRWREPGAGPQAHRHAAGLEGLAKAGGRERRRARLVAAAALGEEAAVVGERAERPHPGRHAVARVRTASERVEGGLVPVHAPGDPLDARLLQQRSEVLDRRAAAVRLPGEAAAAEGRVAAPAQVEAAAEDALGVELARAEHLRPKRALGTEAGQSGAGGEQLRVRGEDAGRALAPAEHRPRRLVAGHFGDIGPGIGARGAHVAGQALDHGRLVLGRGGGRQQGEQGYDEQGNAAHQRPGTR